MLYGQTVQFRHIASGLFLTLETNKLSNEFGCFEIKLLPWNKFSRFKLMPSHNKTKTMSQPVEYEDNFIIENIDETTGYYLHWDTADLYTDTIEDIGSNDAGK